MHFKLILGEEKIAVDSEKTAFFFDIHDTLVRTKIESGKEKRELLPGASKLLRALLQAGFPVRLVTNLTTGSPEALLAPFQKIVSLKPEHLLTSADVATRILKKHKFQKIFVIGRKSLRSYFRQKRFSVLNPSRDAQVAALKDPPPVIIGFPYPFSVLQEQLPGVVRALAMGAAIFVLDRKWSVELGGTVYPAELALAQMLLKAAGRSRQAVRITGKPSSLFFREALNSLPDEQREQVFIVGDTPATDLSPPKKLPITPIGVMTGPARNKEILKQEVSKPKTQRKIPYVVRNLSEVSLSLR